MTAFARNADIPMNTRFDRFWDESENEVRSPPRVSVSAFDPGPDEYAPFGGAVHCHRKNCRRAVNH